MLEISAVFLRSVLFWLLTASLATIYELDRENQSLTIIFKTAFSQEITKKHGFDKIDRIKLDTDYKDNFNKGRIVLELSPSCDYIIDEFADLETGKNHFQIIKNFLDNSRKES